MSVWNVHLLNLGRASRCVPLPRSSSLPDADAENVSLEPDSITFMEALLAREHSETSVQNGFSPADGKDRSDKGEDEAKSSAAAEQSCPVEKHKAALLYPSASPQVATHS